MGLELTHYKLNDDYLYFLTGDDLRGVSVGLELATVPMHSENVKEFECCARVHEVKHVQIAVYDFTGYCFSVDGQSQDFLICQEKEGSLVELKQKLEEAVIANYYKRVLPGQEMPRLIRQAEDSSAFSWEDQESWRGHCQQSSAQSQQSPVSVSSYTQVYEESLRMHWSKGVPL